MSGCRVGLESVVMSWQESAHNLTSPGPDFFILRKIASTSPGPLRLRAYRSVHQAILQALEPDVLSVWEALPRGIERHGRGYLYENAFSR